MRLLGVELTRYFKRRAIIVIMVLGSLTIAAIAVAILYANRPVSDSELARAQQQADQENSQPYYQRRLDRCVENTGDVAACEDRILVSADNMLYRSQLSPGDYKGWLFPMVGLTAAFALLVGATFIGADIASGSVGTQLLFQPSRWKVWLAKIGAVALGTGIFGALALGVSNGAIWVAAQAWDRPIRAGLLGDYSGAVARAVVFVMAAALVGFGLVLIARHTAAALGLIAIYGIALEAVLRGVWPASERWLLSNHVAAFIGGAFRRTIYTDCDGYQGCTGTRIDFTIPSAATYLGLGCAAVILASWLVFRRRDVT
jgi:ABC-2 type transport system permease protein